MANFLWNRHIGMEPPHFPEKIFELPSQASYQRINTPVASNCMHEKLRSIPSVLAWTPTCPIKLPSICTVTAGTLFLFLNSLVQVKVSPGVAFYNSWFTVAYICIGSSVDTVYLNGILQFIMCPLHIYLIALGTLGE